MVEWLIFCFEIRVEFDCLISFGFDNVFKRESVFKEYFNFENMLIIVYI